MGPYYIELPAVSKLPPYIKKETITLVEIQFYVATSSDYNVNSYPISFL